MMSAFRPQSSSQNQSLRKVSLSLLLAPIDDDNNRIEVRSYSGAARSASTDGLGDILLETPGTLRYPSVIAH